MSVAGAGAARAQTWTLTRTVLGCNFPISQCSLIRAGYAEPVDGGYKLVGDDSPYTHALTTYTTVAEEAGEFTFSWDYLNHEPAGFGSYQDPAGYVIDGVEAQLSIDYWDFGCPVETSFCSPRAQSGSVSFSVAAGQTYGFYVIDLDGGFGPGDMTFRQLVGGIPEPAQWLLILVGFGLVGTALRSRAGRPIAA